MVMGCSWVMQIGQLVFLADALCFSRRQKKNRNTHAGCLFVATHGESYGLKLRELSPFQGRRSDLNCTCALSIAATFLPASTLTECPKNTTCEVQHADVAGSSPRLRHALLEASYRLTICVRGEIIPGREIEGAVCFVGV